MQRSKMEREIAILKVVLKRSDWGLETSHYHLMTGVGLSSIDSHRLVSDLIGFGLMSGFERKCKKWSRHFYSLTPEGREAVREFDSLQKRFGVKARDKPIDITPY